MDFGNSNGSEYALISEDHSHSALYRSTADDDDDDDDAPSHHNHNNNAFDLLGEDPLEWLIETDCTQQYLPESSLPLFPFHTITSDDDKLSIHNHHHSVDDVNEDDHNETNIEAMESNAMLLRMTDPNVTVQSLFLPTTSTDEMAILEQ